MISYAVWRFLSATSMSQPRVYGSRAGRRASALCPELSLCSIEAACDLHLMEASMPMRSP